MTDFELIPNVIRGAWQSYDDGPPDVWHLAQGGSLPGRLWFRLSLGEDGRAECTELRIDADRPLTSSVLRAIPLSRIISDFARMPFTDEERGGPMRLETRLRMHYDWSDPVLMALSDQQARLAYLGNAHREVSRRPRRGGVGPTSEELERFRAAYEWALNHEPRAPIKAASEQMSITRATAHRWKALLSGGDGPS